MNSPERSDNGATAIDLGSAEAFSLGVLQIKPSSREVAIDGKVEMIEPRVMQALVALARRAGEVVSREQLVNECWSGRVVGEDAITRCMAKVRRLASPQTFDLETIPRVGYRLIPAPVPCTPEAQPTQSQEVGEIAAPEYRTRRSSILRIAAALLLLVFVGVSYVTWRFMQAVGAATPWEIAALVDISGRPKFAVLPFESLGDGVEIDYLAGAIPVAINNQLTGLGFQGVSPALTSKYRGERKAQAAAELKPRYLIDGSVSVRGGQLHVTARVDSAIRPVTIWSQDFAVSVDEASELPARIATALTSLTIFRAVGASGRGYSPEATAGMVRVNERLRIGDDLGAYLVAKELMRSHSGAAITKSSYAMSTIAALDLLPYAERAGALARARKAVQEVATLSDRGAPMLQQAVTPPVEWHMREQELRRGIATNAPAASLRSTLAMSLANAGHLADATSIAHAATVIDPLSSTDLWVHATLLEMTGRREEMNRVLERAEVLWPRLGSFVVLRFSDAVSRGDLAVATAMLGDPALQAILDPPAAVRPNAAILRALQTREPTAIAAVERDCVDPTRLARYKSGPCLRALLSLGRLDAFFAAAINYFPNQRASSAAERDMLWLQNPQAWRSLRILFHADAAPLRADERFIAIAERTGLLDYWRTTGKWPDFCASEPASVCNRMRAM